MIAGLAGGAFIYFMILAVGSIATNNNIALPGALASNFSKISGNSTAGTVVGGISPLESKVNTAYGTTSNQTFIAGTIGSVTVATTIFSALGGIWNSYILFIDGGLTVVHINPSFGNLVGIAIIIGLLALAIVSAILLFPV
jgi:hypothetical protein